MPSLIIIRVVVVGGEVGKMVTATTNTGDKIIISDNVNPAAGNFTVYLNGSKINWMDNQKPIVNLSVGNDESTASMIGINNLIIRFLECTYPKDGTGGNWEVFLRAKGFWSDAANKATSLLYLQMKDENGYNTAKYAVSPYTGVSQIRGRIIDVIADLSHVSHYKFTVVFQRFTS